MIMGNFNNELKNYQSIPRELIFDNTMSDRARFLFCYMASKPNDWNFYIANMTKELGYSDETLRKYINELISSGWLIRGGQSNLGKFGAVEYTLKSKKSDTEKTDTEENGDGKIPIHKEIYNNKDNNKDKKEDTIVSKKGKVFFDVRNDLSYVDAEYYTIWNEWLDYKDEIKKQYKTQRGATMQYHSLIKYSEDNPILANAIVKRSIEQSWDGFFALSQKQKDLFMSKKSPYIDKDSYITNRVEDMQKEIDKKRLIIEGKEYR